MSRIGKFRSSLAGRIIMRLAVLQVLVVIVAVALATIKEPGPGDHHLLSLIRVGNLVTEAVEIGPEGRPVIGETPALKQFREERPEVRIAMMDGSGHVFDGSDAELAEVLETYGFPAFQQAVFTIPETIGGPLAGQVLAAASTLAEPYGEITLLTAGNELRAADVPDVVLHISSLVVARLGPVLIVIILVVPLSIGRALRPLIAASREAATIDLRSRDLRLPENEDIPSDLLPLVRGINAGLERLDEGFSRQQRFVAQAAHEMRTPLAILAARIDGLADRQEAQALRRNIERMRVLVDQWLLVARLERRDVALNEPVDLVKLARDVVADCAPMAIAQGRELSLTPEATQLIVHGNADALLSALVNLVSNAARFEPVGGTVEVVVREPAEILVIDHGPGIPAADKERAFEPFWCRGEGQTGAGLGLTIVKEAALAHDGDITVEDTPGGGATFRFRVAKATPLQDGPASATGAAIKLAGQAR